MKTFSLTYQIPGKGRGAVALGFVTVQVDVRNDENGLDAADIGRANLRKAGLEGYILVKTTRVKT